MRHSLNPKRVIASHFKPHLTTGERSLSWQHVILYLAIPLVVGYVGVKRIGPATESSLPILLAVYGILAAVLASLLPLIYSIVGQTNTTRQFNSGERILVQQELDRLQSLQDLYATISYSTFLLVVAIFCCVGIAIIPPEWGEALSLDLRLPLSVAVYFTGVSTAVSILDVGNGVFDAMEDQVRVTKQAIIRNSSQDGPRA